MEMRKAETGECANCRTVTELHELEPLTRPLEPGDTVPDGAEVFELRPGEEPTETRPTLNDALGACMVLIAKQPDTSHRLVSPDLQALRDISEAIARAMDECKAIAGELTAEVEKSADGFSDVQQTVDVALGSIDKLHAMADQS